jgi:predicted nucleotidyltransferase
MPLIKKIEELAERYPVSALYVFGSRALEIKSLVEGKEEEWTALDSDVDVGVQPELGQRLTAQDRVEIVLALEKLFGVKRVDLVVLPEADAFLALNIIRGEILFCRDFDQQAEDELYVLRRAGDLSYFQRERIQMVLNEGGR